MSALTTPISHSPIVNSEAVRADLRRRDPEFRKDHIHSLRNHAPKVFLPSGRFTCNLNEIANNGLPYRTKIHCRSPSSRMLEEVPSGQPSTFRNSASQAG